MSNIGLRKKIRRAGYTALAAIWMVMPVYAADTVVTTDGNASSTITYYKASDYSVTIPAIVTASDIADVNINITSSRMNLTPAEMVTVKISDGIESGNVTLVRQNVLQGKTASKLSLPLKLSTQTVEKSTVVAEFRDGVTPTTNLLANQLKAEKIITSQATEAGDYRGSITFTIQKSSIA